MPTYDKTPRDCPQCHQPLVFQPEDYTVVIGPPFYLDYPACWSCDDCAYVERADPLNPADPFADPDS